MRSRHAGRTWSSSCCPTETPLTLASLFDLEMLLAVGGRERTEVEYRGLLGRAGFRLTTVVPTVSPFRSSRPSSYEPGIR